jgi:transposase
MRAMLPAGHLAWQVLKAVSELDLAGFGARYRDDGQGQAPYDPAMMVALLFYCLLKGIRSCRKMAAACTDDLGAMVICGGRRPHYATVSRFFTRHRGELKGLFVQVLGLCVAEGLAGPAVAAVDGSPVSANTARSSNADEGKLAAMIAGLQEQTGAEVEAVFAAVEAAGAAQPPLQDRDEAGGDDGDDLPRGVLSGALDSEVGGVWGR